jgi:hypothetical protein
MATHNEVAHAWAHQTGRCRKGHRMFYEGDTIYSYGYHFPIAKLVEADGCTRSSSFAATVVLMTVDSRSVSTAKHKSIVYRAVSHLRVFTVPHLSPCGAQHVANWEWLVASAKENADKADRARTRGAFLLSEAQDFIEQANDYSYVFGLGRMEVSLQGLGVAVADIEARMEEARRSAEAAKRLEWAKKYRQHKHRIVAWLDGYGEHMSGLSSIHTPKPYVRVVSKRGDYEATGSWDASELQTSWGVSVPLDVALKVYQYAKLVRAGVRKPCSLPGDVGGYGKAHIDHRGNIKVGCHTIPFLYARLAAVRAGLDNNMPVSLQVA